MGDFASAADLATYRSGDPDLMVSAAEATVRSYCGWHIYPSRTDTTMINATGRSLLPLPTLYLTDVATVEETQSEGSVITLLAGQDFEWSQAGYLTRRRWDGFWYWRNALRSVTVTYTHGYTEMPLDVQAVVLSLASKGTEGDVGQEIVGPFQSNPGRNPDGTSGGMVLTGMHRSVLDRYRIPAQP